MSMFLNYGVFRVIAKKIIEPSLVNSKYCIKYAMYTKNWL